MKRRWSFFWGASVLAAAVGQVSGQQWDSVIFRDDFDAPGGALDTNAWVVNQPASWWWVQGRTFYPSPIYHTNGPFPHLENGRCIIEHHLCNPYDLAATNTTFLGGEIHTVMLFNPGRPYRFEARVKCHSYPNGLVTSFFTYGYDGANSDEIDFEFLSKQVNDDATWPAGDPVMVNTWNESQQCPQAVMVTNLDLTAWNTFRIYWCPGRRVQWTWLDPIRGETLLRTEENQCLPNEPMALFFNFWAPTAGWPDAYDPGLQPVDDPGLNQIHTYEIDYAEVRVPMPPSLGISRSGSHCELSWPTNAGTCFGLTSTTNLSHPLVWHPVTNAVSVVDDRYTVTVSIGESTMFFSLNL